jgi:hypothetical protein
MTTGTPLATTPTFFGRSRLVFYGALFGLLALAAGLRLLNLTNPPLDFHAWRQLRAATIARGMYYEMLPSADPDTRREAIRLSKSFEVLEPRIFERLVAWTYYLTGGERLWIARLYAILYWLVGGAGVYALARRLTSVDGALIALSCFLFLPYGVAASRSFQPDPMMVMWVILAAYALYRWSEKTSWVWAILAGLFAGLAILIKVFAVYPVAASTLCVVLSTRPLKRAWQDTQVWVMGGLMILIPGLYYILQVGYLAPGYLSAWWGGFRELLITPRFYIVWLRTLDVLMTLPILLAGLAGVLLLTGKGRALLLGLWAGYALIGLTVPSLIITHDYYNLILIPVVALSLAPLGHLFLEKMVDKPRLWQTAFVGVFLLSVAYPAWIARNDLVAKDYRPEILGWIKMGRELPQDAKIIGITHDYGTRLAYYGWTWVKAWPYALDQEMRALGGSNVNLSDPVWKQRFEEETQGYDYFLVTIRGELDAQPVLKEMLAQFPAQDTGGYILYDLRQRTR